MCENQEVLACPSTRRLQNHTVLNQKHKRRRPALFFICSQAQRTSNVRCPELLTPSPPAESRIPETMLSYPQHTMRPGHSQCTPPSKTCAEPLKTAPRQQSVRAWQLTHQKCTSTNGGADTAQRSVSDQQSTHGCRASCLLRRGRRSHVCSSSDAIPFQLSPPVHSEALAPCSGATRGQSMGLGTSC